MKKLLIFTFSICLLISLAACGNQVQEAENDEPTVSETRPASEVLDASSFTESETLPDSTSETRVRLTFEGGEAIIRLEDNAAARELVSHLPMTQSFEDYNNI